MATPTPLFSDYSRDWLALHPVAPKTAEDYSWLIETYLIPVFGDTPIGDLTYRDVQQWVIQTAPRAYHQVRQSLSILRQVYHLAQVEDLVSKSPVDLVKLPPAPRPVPDPLSPSEVQKIADELSGRDRLMFLTLVFGGLRFSELAALTPASIKADYLLVSGGIMPARGGGWLYSDGKTHQKRRVYLPGFLVSDLRDYADSVDTDLLFTSTVGTPVHRTNWHTRVLSPACARAGVRRVTPHALRDTCASLCLRSGVAPQVVAAHLGHSDSATTLRHYAGVVSGDLEGLSMTLQDAILGVVPPAGLEPATKGL